MAADPSANGDAKSSTPATPSSPRKVEFVHPDDAMRSVCADFMKKKCSKGSECSLVHDRKLCFYYWRNAKCKYNEDCRKNHFIARRDEKTSVDKLEEAHGRPNGKSKKKAEQKGNKDTTHEHKKKDTKRDSKRKTRSVKKNTETWDPMTRPVDVRIVYDLGRGSEKFSTPLTSRDVLLAPNIFADYRKGELYSQLVKEIEACTIPKERLLKMWHGNDKIDGTHLIADDKTRWKKECPTFDLVVQRLRDFFQMNIQATRFNWYKDTSQWKPFHHDAAAVKPEKAEVQNFTVAVSFGATRDAAFEHAETRTVVSMPQPDGCVYAFSKDTNIIWRHGILQDVPVRQEGRISVIAWGWVDGMSDVVDE